MACTDRGCKRQINEDSISLLLPEAGFLSSTEPLMAIVADGMGGHAAGEVASKLAVDTLVNAYSNEEILCLNDLEAACRKANLEIWMKSLENAQYVSMGTTLTALVCLGKESFFVHIGDSRIYRKRGDKLDQLTSDHTLRNEIEAFDVNQAVPINRHILSRAMGVQDQVEFQVSASMDIRDGDQYLLCSDGLYDLISDQELLALLELASIDLVADTMLSLARHRGGPDNISLILLRVLPTY